MKSIKNAKLTEGGFEIISIKHKWDNVYSVTINASPLCFGSVKIMNYMITEDGKHHDDKFSIKPI